MGCTSSGRATWPTAIYFVEEGASISTRSVATIEPGEMFGELAFFSESRRRTLSARCVGKVRVLR